MQRRAVRRWSEILKRLGIAAFRFADAAKTGGALSTALDGAYNLFQAGKIANSPHNPSDGLNWDFPCAGFYRAERDNFITFEEDGEAPFVLPQVPVFMPRPGFDVGASSVELENQHFVAPMRVDPVLELHKKWAKEHEHNLLFDGENARLIGVSEKSLRFQGCSYFDYVSTNLALDYPLDVGGSLRKQVHAQGRLEPLEASMLANSCGVNGLVFSRDGQLIIQHRSRHVLGSGLN